MCALTTLSALASVGCFWILRGSVVFRSRDHVVCNHPLQHFESRARRRSWVGPPLAARQSISPNPILLYHPPATTKLERRSERHRRLVGVASWSQFLRLSAENSRSFWRGRGLQIDTLRISAQNKSYVMRCSTPFPNQQSNPSGLLRLSSLMSFQRPSEAMHDVKRIKSWRNPHR